MRVALALLVALLASPAWPQGDPIGPEFRVNTHTTNDQQSAVVAWAPSGDFVVVWQGENQDGSSLGVFGQRYSAPGVALGPEFRVNIYTTAAQFAASVAVDAVGNFVVVWESDQGSNGFDVVGQRYSGSGSPLGSEFRVNTFTAATQSFPNVASDPAGSFVVLWMSNGQDGQDFGVFGQRYSSAGVKLGPEFRVNTYTTGAQYDPAAAFDAARNFVVVWSSAVPLGDREIFGQRYASTGSPLGPEFRVSTYTTTSFQNGPSIAVDAAGNFVVVWQREAAGATAHDVFGQRYASSGSPLGPEFAVNTYTPLKQFAPSVAMDAAGNFVVVWASQGDGSSYGLRPALRELGSPPWLGVPRQHAYDGHSGPGRRRGGRRRRLRGGLAERRSGRLG